MVASLHNTGKGAKKQRSQEHLRRTRGRPHPALAGWLFLLPTRWPPKVDVSARRRVDALMQATNGCIGAGVCLAPPPPRTDRAIDRPMPDRRRRLMNADPHCPKHALRFADATCFKEVRMTMCALAASSSDLLGSSLTLRRHVRPVAAAGGDGECCSPIHHALLLLLSAFC